MSNRVGIAEVPQAETASAPISEAIEDAIASDAERYEAVPEHHWDAKTIVEHYGEDPENYPPCIRALGKAGIEFVQSVAEARNNPDRGPSMKEIIAARKREARNKTAEAKMTEVYKDKEVAPRPKNESPYTLKPKEADNVDASAALTLEQEHLASPTSEISEEILAPVSTVEAITVEAAQITRPEVELPNNEISLVKEVNEGKVSTSEREIDVDDPATDAAIETEAVTAQSLEQAVSTETTDVPGSEVIESQPESNTEERPEDPTLDSNIMPIESALEYIAPGRLAIEIEPETVHESSTDMIAQVSEEASYLPSDLDQELSSYIETLEPEKAELAVVALETLVEVLETKQALVEVGAELSEDDIKDIQEVFVQLLEALDLDYQDETVKHLMQELFSPELMAEISEDKGLSIGQLNRLGTEEYKSNSTASLFMRIIQMIKQKIEPHLRLGGYVVSASMT